MSFYDSFKQLSSIPWKKAIFLGEIKQILSSKVPFGFLLIIGLLLGTIFADFFWFWMADYGLFLDILIGQF
jgi:hypothetical protein